MACQNLSPCDCDKALQVKARLKLASIQQCRFPSSSSRILEGSWLVISGVISRITIIIAPIRGLIIPLITSREPPSKSDTLQYTFSGEPLKSAQLQSKNVTTALFRKSLPGEHLRCVVPKTVTEAARGLPHASARVGQFS